MVPIDYFDSVARRTWADVALIEGSTSVTFGDVCRLSHHVAAEVAEATPAGAPARVVVYAPNDYRVLVTMVGIMRAGASIVPIHAGSPIENICRTLQRIQPTSAFYHSSVERQVVQIGNAMPAISRWVCMDRFDVASTSPVDLRFESDWIDASGNRDRPVFHWGTSGTTGEPKIVIDDVVTFDGALTFVRAQQQATGNRYVSLAIAPLSHGAGPHSFAILTLGGTVIVVRHFDAPEVLSLIEKHGVTDMWLPPTALYLLLDHPDVRKRDLSSLRHVQMGTAAVAPAKFREAIEVFGPCVSQTYGQIETGFVTVLDAETAAEAAGGLHPERLASAGRGIGVNQFAVMDEEGRVLSPCEPGEIVVRGRCVKRYLDGVATAEARRFGWHHTGDLGYIDEDGFLFIVGRKKDIVNMAGIKIPAAEIERVILELPSVLECAVIAVPDRVRGEVPRAIVVPKTGQTLGSDELLSYCRQRLGVSRGPASVEVRGEHLPRSAAGKIDKLRLRALAAVSEPA